MRPGLNYILPFADVAQDAAYAEAVRWAASEKIVNGFGDGTFRPEEPVTRQDLAVMLMRFCETVLQRDLPADQPAPTFTDAGQIALYAAESIYHLQKAGIVTGSDGAFRPLDGAQRCEAAKMLVLLVG